MKMSGIFITPVSIQKIELDANEVARSFVGDGGECKAASIAINNHDALVEVLTELIKDYFELMCDHSGGYNEDDPVAIAERLLDKIKTEE